ncbi:ribonuclease HI, partial [Klebsiella grimontii]|nr:ribonuclease HI [Klebsiella grimontii]
MNFTHFVRSVQVLLKPVLGSRFFFSKKFLIFIG